VATLSYDVQPGDVIGFSSRSSLGRWVNYATLGIPGHGLSHIGIAALSPLSSYPGIVLFESTTTCKRPCLLEGQVVHGVQCQPLIERVADYEAIGRAWVYPLSATLTDVQADLLTALCVADCGKQYDYPGAVRSRDLGLGWLARIVYPRAENLHALFCSELVATRLRDLRRLEVANASDWAPNALAREMRRQEVTLKRVPLTLVQGA